MLLYPYNHTMHNLTNRDNNDLLTYLIEHGDISVYDCSNRDFPAVLLRKKFGQVRVFSHKPKKEIGLPDDFSLHTYKDISEIHHSKDEVCFWTRSQSRFYSYDSLLIQNMYLCGFCRVCPGFWESLVF